jgi:hypothetical protein
MSVPDSQLDDDTVECRLCGAIFLQCGGEGDICWGCAEDNEDLYADAKIQDEKEGI